jgi:catechol 2,3-dioxygenase-like lactoylglutathione lyase family enzyme
MLADMDPRISLVTLVVDDVERSKGFYVDGLGWPAEMHVAGEVLMLKVGERLLLSLWDRAHAEDELGPVAAGEGVPPVTLAHNLGTRARVDEVLAAAGAAGADPVVPAVQRDWGGYSGYFADPDGYRWEVAWAPGEVADLVLPPDEPRET